MVERFVGLTEAPASGTLREQGRTDDVDATEFALARRIKRLGMNLGASKNASAGHTRRVYRTPTGFYVAQSVLLGHVPASGYPHGRMEAHWLRGVDESTILERFEAVETWERRWITNVVHMTATYRRTLGSGFQVCTRKELNVHLRRHPMWSDGSDTYYYEQTYLRKALMALTGKTIRVRFTPTVALLCDEHGVLAAVALRQEGPLSDGETEAQLQHRAAA